MAIVRKLLVFVLGTLFLTNRTKAVAITGPQGGVDSATGQRPFRLEISTFQNNGPAFDLYILSFQRFVQQNQTNILSYYQVAGKRSLILFAWTMISNNVNRNSRPSVCRLGWCQWAVRKRLLYTQLHSFPNMAPPLSCLVRGMWGFFV